MGLSPGVTLPRDVAPGKSVRLWAHNLKLCLNAANKSTAPSKQPRRLSV